MSEKRNSDIDEAALKRAALNRLDLLCGTIIEKAQERNEPEFTSAVLDVIGDSIREAAKANIPPRPQRHEESPG